MAGHSRPKDGVASGACPAIHEYHSEIEKARMPTPGHGALAPGVAKAAASRAANCRSISFALARSTGCPRLPSLPV
jgi:hypothetical protein